MNEMDALLIRALDSQVVRASPADTEALCNAIARFQVELLTATGPVYVSQRNRIMPNADRAEASPR